MTFLLAGLFLVGLIEILLAYLPTDSQKPVAILVALILVLASAWLIIASPAAWTLLIGFFSVFRIINIARLIDGRKQPSYLRTSYLRSVKHLIAYQLVVLVFAYLSRLTSLSHQAKWTLLASLQLVAAAIVFLSLRRSLIKTKPQVSDKYISDKDLPSITVAIPARNETDDLDACLSSLIKSTYPKLEILVLDDCSQNKHTPEIIKQFAHDGVRFLAGKLPPDSWSAKNYAYQQLAEEANGQIILFCGVDVRFSPETLRQMIELMIARRKTMLSFIPSNSSDGIGSLKLLAIQPWRYFWELGLPRRQLNRPPVLSTCWLIDKATLLGDGSFKAVGRDVLPERYFARESIKHNDGYSFIQSGEALGLSCIKSYSEQYDTAVRTRYPVLKQRLELASLVSLVEAAVLVMPIILLFVELGQRNWWLVALSAINFIILGYCFLRVVRLTYKKSMILAIVAMPLTAAYDIGLLLYSMWQYEFNEVIWKGRNVCLPVMYIATKLN